MLHQEPKTVEWMPHGDKTVETVLNKAIAEAYSHAGRLGDLSHPFVSAIIKKLAKKFIGICVNVKGSSVSVQACRSMVLMLLAKKNICTKSRAKITWRKPRGDFYLKKKTPSETVLNALFSFLANL